MFFFNPCSYYIANDKMSDLNFRHHNDKEYIRTQGIVVSICLISTVIIYILAHSVEYKYGSLFAVILMSIISLFLQLCGLKIFLNEERNFLKRNTQIKINKK